MLKNFLTHDELGLGKKFSGVKSNLREDHMFKIEDQMLKLYEILFL